MRNSWTLCWLCLLLSEAAWAEAPPELDRRIFPSDLVWSLGLKLNMDRMSHPREVDPGLMLGLRYGRWRTGAVDGESWHRFGQVKTDNTLTYDLNDASHFRTSLSASVVNMDHESRFDLFESGRKTLRGRATIDYLGWSHWSVGLALTQDMLGRGAGTSLSPSLTYRQAVNEDSTILLTHSFTFAKSDAWRYRANLDPQIDRNQPSGWGGTMDTSLTLRQRWKPQWSWFFQISRSQTMHGGDPTVQTVQNWSSQAGVIYFDR